MLADLVSLYDHPYRRDISVCHSGLASGGCRLRDGDRPEHENDRRSGTCRLLLSCNAVRHVPCYFRAPEDTTSQTQGGCAHENATNRFKTGVAATLLLTGLGTTAVAQGFVGGLSSGASGDVRRLLQINGSVVSANVVWRRCGKRNHRRGGSTSSPTKTGSWSLK